jgi:D-alanyl-D-alanine carboxypeptidase (penicillin-binding protein 5/6)
MQARGRGIVKAYSLATLLVLALPGSAAGLDEPRGPALPSPASAPIALLVDVSSGQTLFARDSKAPMLPASMTKVMTCLIAFDLIRAGKLDQDAVFTVRPDTAARMAGKGSSLGLVAGEQVRVRDLIAGVATASANDASVVLAEGALGSEAAWIAAMNARAASLGMKDSRFASTNGLPDGGRTRVTAQDMARLGIVLVSEHPALYRTYIGHKTMTWRDRVLYSHNPLAGIFPGADGIKTGHTREAGFTFLGSIERAGRRLVLVIGRAPNEAERARAAADLAEWGYAAWDSRPFLTPDRVVGQARVQGGAERKVPLVVPEGARLAVPEGGAPGRLTGRIVYQGPLRAPIAKGQRVGLLEVSVAGQGSHSLPLVTARAVGLGGPFDRMVDGLLGLFE